MNDALVVRRRQSLRNLRGIVGGLARRQGAVVELRAQAAAFEQLGNDEGRAVLLADIVNGKNVGMIQRRDRARFLLEATEPVGVAGKRLRQHLERDLAAKARIASAIHLSHTARAERRDDFVGT